MHRLILPLALALAAPAAAQETGEELFMTYCATCHGTGAEGDGPMAPILLVEPADLTGLAERAGGTFPTFEVVQSIDGRDPMVAHGGEMPIWGGFFAGEGEALATAEGQPILTSPEIAAITRWLETIQR